jgi:hypothetical protein
MPMDCVVLLIYQCLSYSGEYRLYLMGRDTRLCVSTHQMNLNNEYLSILFRNGCPPEIVH